MSDAKVFIMRLIEKQIKLIQQDIQTKTDEIKKWIKNDEIHTRFETELNKKFKTLIEHHKHILKLFDEATDSRKEKPKNYVPTTAEEKTLYKHFKWFSSEIKRDYDEIPFGRRLNRKKAWNKKLIEAKALEDKNIQHKKVPRGFFKSIKEW